MLRLPLKLNEPSYSWDRSLPDHVLFEKALNTENVKDMVNYIAQIDLEVDSFTAFRKIAAINDYNEALNLFQRQGEDAALPIFNKIILQAPKDGLAIPLSLRARGNINYKNNRFKHAANDFEFLLYLTDNMTENILEIYGKLVVCFYMMGKYDRVKESYELYNQHLSREEQRRGRGARANLLNLDIDMYTSTVQKLFNEIKHQNSTPGPLKKETRKPKLFSNMLRTEHMGDGQVRQYCKINHPSNAIVMSERPIARTVCAPWVQCEECLELSDHMFTCFECRLKTYCSMDCVRSDIHHKEECKGIKYLIVLMLNSQQLFRVFIQVICFIKRNILARKGLTRLKTAEKILTAIRTHSKDHKIPLLKLLGEEYDYRDMSDMQFSTIVATSVRMTVFIAEKTELIEMLRPTLSISHKQEMLIVGSILMQLQYHLQKGSYLLSFEIPSKRPKMFESMLRIEERMKNLGIRVFPKKGAQSANDFYYFNPDILSLRIETYLDVNIDAMKKTPLPQALEEPTGSFSDNLITPMQEYCDYIQRLVLQNEFIEDVVEKDNLSQHMARMDYVKREVFIESYIREYNRNLFIFFLNKRLAREEYPDKQIIILLGRSLQKFRHSCDPNVDIIFLTSGIIVAKTLKPLKTGDECFISYRTRYFSHKHETRKNILEQYNTQCECRYCQMPEKIQPFTLHSNIYCVPSCRTEFGYVDNVCPKCGCDYTMLLQVYANKIEILETLCTAEDDEREIHKHWIVLNQVSEQLFPPYHEYRIMQRVKYAKFIAMNNFVEEAYDMTLKVYTDMNKYYPEESIVFTHYQTILEILSLLQYYNIDQKLNTASISKLQDMNTLGVTLINAQLKHLRIYEKFDQSCGPVLADYKLFCTWKEKMFLMHIDVELLKVLVKADSKVPGLQSSRY